MKEFGKENLPVLCNMNFGALAEIDCEKQTFSILEPGVI